MNIKEAYHFKKVNEQISCSGTLKNISLQSLLDERYDVVINLLPNDNDVAIEKEKEIIEKLGIQYNYIPVDWDAPKYSDYEAFDTVMSAIQSKKVHIHCAANFRASAFYAIYAYKHYGWSKKQCRDFIRSIWTLSDYPVWNTFVGKVIE